MFQIFFFSLKSANIYANCLTSAFSHKKTMFIFFFIPLGRSVSITRKKKLDPTQEVMLELGVVLQKKKEPKDPSPHHIRTHQEVCLEQALVSAYRLLRPFDYFRITVFLNVFIVASNSLFRRIAHHFIVCCRYGLLMDI